jgi:hypothetical protein
VGKWGPAGAGDAGEAEGVVDPDGPEVGPVGAGGPQDVRLNEGGDKVALPFQDGRDDQPVGLERPRRPKGEHRVALLHGQVQPTQKAVPDAVAAAQDDPTPTGSEHQESEQLPKAGPLGATLAVSAAGPRRQQSDQQPIEKGWNPEGEDSGGGHTYRARQQRLRRGGPGLGGVIPGAGELEEDAEHVDQPNRQMLVVGAEEDGGDLADEPHQAAGGEQQRRDHQPEGVGDVLVVAVGVAVMPHWRHLPAAPAPRGAGPGTRPGRWR